MLAAASYGWSGRPRWTNTASTSGRTPRSSRFQQVYVGEPSVGEDTIGILRQAQKTATVHPQVRITDSALVAAATERFRYHRPLHPTRPSTWSTRAANHCGWRSTRGPSDDESSGAHDWSREMALSEKEGEEASADGWPKLCSKLADQKKKLAELTTASGRTRRTRSKCVTDLKDAGNLRGESSRTERDGDLAKAARLRLDAHPGWSSTRRCRRRRPEEQVMLRRSVPATSPTWCRRGPSRPVGC